jgi:hypothetical protein
MSRHIIGLACLTLTSAAWAEGHPRTSDFRVTTRKPATDYYLYVGAGWSDPSGDEFDASLFPVEVRVITQDDWEFAFDSSLVVPDGRANEFEYGDGLLRVTKGFRDVGPIDYLSFDIGGRAWRADEPQWSNQIEGSLQARAQGGYTRLGYDLSVTYLYLDDQAGFGDHEVVYSAGYRGQFGWLHFGIDLARLEFDDDHSDVVDLTLMRRTGRGSSYYFVAQQEMSSGASWYAGIGVEYHFGR